MAARQQIDNPRKFFDKVVTPSYRDFMKKPSNFRRAYAMAMPLFNLSEWLFKFKEADLKRTYGAQCRSAGAFFKEVERLVPNAGYIRDLSNASKHVALDPRKAAPSTGVQHSANTHIVSSGQSSNSARKKKMVMDDGGNLVSLDACAKDLYDFWLALVNQLYPPPPRRQRRTIQYSATTAGPTAAVITGTTTPSANS